jgi:hypothetical protein
MKILLLHPEIHPGHKIAADFQSRGIVWLFPRSSEEAWYLLQLHGQSVGLAVIHREGDRSEPKDAALQLIVKIKSDPLQSDLPVILTTQEWSEEQCAHHQETAGGANAYLYSQFNEVQLLSVIEAVVGRSFPKLAKSGPPMGKFGAFDAEIPLAVELPGATSPPVVEAKPSAPPPRKPSSSTASKGDDGGLEISIALDDDSSSLEVQSSGSRVATQEPPPPPDQPSESPPAQQTAGDLTIPTLVSTTAPESIVPDLGLDLLGEDSSEVSAVVPSDSPPDLGLDLLEDEQDSEMRAELNADAPPVLPPSDLSPDPVPDLSPDPGEESAEDPASVLKPADDPEAAQEMPYLYHHQERSGIVTQPLGDFVVPGGAAQSPDLETIKKYLLLREQDVSVLSGQLRSSKQQIAAYEKELREERLKNSELAYTCQEQKGRIDEFERKGVEVSASLEKECQELRGQLRTRTDQMKLVEIQAREVSAEIDRLKDRVRGDIRKIRVREKELENRLEITKKDAEALITARETKLIELKRKLDLMEFNMDLIQDQYSKERELSEKLKERLGKLAQVVRIADGLLDKAGLSALTQTEDLMDSQESPQLNKVS